MRLKEHRSLNFIVTLVITALLLTGAVPSFALDDSADGEDSTRNVLPAISIDQTDAPKLNGTSAIVLDMDTGTVIYEKNADKVREPASLTKILNCMVVLDKLPLNQVITVQEGVETEGSVIGLVPGEKITVEELLYGMMMESGNDAAQVLGLAAGEGSQDRFSDLMDEKARECGATHTDYSNPNGLNEDPGHLNYTTARDLALVSREAMKDPRFRKIVSTSKHTIPETNMSEKRKLVNSNACLWLKKQKTRIRGREVPFKYDGCNGIKTGFTSDAGYCFVGSAEHEGTDFLVVTLNTEDSEQRFRDAILLWNYAFDKYECYTVLEAGKSAGVNRVWHGKKRTVELATDIDLGVTIHKGTAEDQEFTTEFRLDDARADAPIRKGQKMGQVLVFNKKGRLVGAENLYAMSSVGVGGPLSRIGIADEDLPMAGGIAGGLVLIILILCIRRRVKRKRTRSRQQEEIRGELQTMRTSGVGMTAAELSDLTGEEIIQPIPKGPSRITDEELNAWTSTKKRSEDETYASSRFGGRSVRGGYGRPEGQPVSGETPLSDDELFDLLENANPIDLNQPRRHGKLTREEMEQVMKPAQSKKDDGHV